ncbi:unnamed protein product [Trichogramma brassicae]|uniref:Uncharacterized protein n=1 Tax=Trichogramma brassicae TaxID=86971 RepID=A0A6H5I6X6_9HYME|nr:unnamed protein product [Trichogramma brassicae]
MRRKRALRPCVHERGPHLRRHVSRLLRGHTLLASPPELSIFRTRCLVPSCERGSRFCRRWQVPDCSVGYILEVWFSLPALPCESPRVLVHKSKMRDITSGSSTDTGDYLPDEGLRVQGRRSSFYIARHSLGIACQIYTPLVKVIRKVLVVVVCSSWLLHGEPRAAAFRHFRARLLSRYIT